MSKPDLINNGRSPFKSPQDLQSFLWSRTNGEYKCMGEASKNEGHCRKPLGKEKRGEIGKHLVDFVNAGFPSPKARESLKKIVSSSLCRDHEAEKKIQVNPREGKGPAKTTTQGNHLYETWLGELRAAFPPGDIPAEEKKKKSRRVPTSAVDQDRDVWRKERTNSVPIPGLKRALTSTGVAAGRLTELSKQFFKQLLDNVREKKAQKSVPKKGARKNDAPVDLEPNNSGKENAKANSTNIPKNNIPKNNIPETNDSEAKNLEPNDPEPNLNLSINLPSTGASLPTGTSLPPVTPTRPSLRRSPRNQEKSARSNRTNSPSPIFDHDNINTNDVSDLTPFTSYSSYSSVSSVGSHELKGRCRSALFLDQSPTPAARRKCRDDGSENIGDIKIGEKVDVGEVIDDDKDIDLSEESDISEESEPSEVIIKSKAIDNSKLIDDNNVIRISNIISNGDINNSKEGVVLYYQNDSEKAIMTTSLENLKHNFPNVKISTSTKERNSNDNHAKSPKGFSPECFEDNQRLPKKTLESMVKKLQESVWNKKKFREGYIYGYRVHVEGHGHLDGCNEFIKIGVTQETVETRLKDWEANCGVKPVLLFQAWMPYAPVVMESMIHGQLYGRQLRQKCHKCERKSKEEGNLDKKGPVIHREWFRLELKDIHIALDAVLTWQAFSMSRPFTEHRYLREDWRIRTLAGLDRFKTEEKWDPNLWVGEYIWRELQTRAEKEGEEGLEWTSEEEEEGVCKQEKGQWEVEAKVEDEEIEGEECEEEAMLEV